MPKLCDIDEIRIDPNRDCPECHYAVITRPAGFQLHASHCSRHRTKTCLACQRIAQDQPKEG